MTIHRWTVAINESDSKKINSFLGKACKTDYKF